MSLDRLDSKRGLFSIVPETRLGTAAQGLSSSASTVASNVNPGGLEIGAIAGFAPAMYSDQGGGAIYMRPAPWYATTTGSWGQTMATGGTISHFNAGMVGVNVTVTANNLQLQPPTKPGQHLILVNCGTKSCSFDTIGSVYNWSTTGTVTTQTVTAQVGENAFTVNSGSARWLIANPFAVTTTGQWPIGLWKMVK